MKRESGQIDLLRKNYPQKPGLIRVNRPYHFIFLKGRFPQTLRHPFLNALSQVFRTILILSKKTLKGNENTDMKLANQRNFKFSSL